MVIVRIRIPRLKFLEDWLDLCQCFIISIIVIIKNIFCFTQKYSEEEINYQMFLCICVYVHRAKIPGCLAKCLRFKMMELRLIGFLEWLLLISRLIGMLDMYVFERYNKGLCCL